MYSAGVSIRSRNSDGVVKAVRGLRETQGLHDVEAIGLIDRDDRTDDEMANLQAEGIYALTPIHRRDEGRGVVNG